MASKKNNKKRVREANRYMLEQLDGGTFAPGVIRPINVGSKESKSKILKPCGDIRVSFGTRCINGVIG